jgi:predicted acylesterase/phospholipase RssA
MLTLRESQWKMTYSIHPRLEAPPPAEAEKIQVLGIPNARFFIDRITEAILQEALLADAHEVASVPPGPNGERPPANYLALSGGGEKGAFGAGLMAGWTASGQRPEFKLVTGVSTGALIAPFAFLGPTRDQQLRRVFTDITQENIFNARWLMAALYDDALADTTPLFTLICEFVNAEMLADIAREYSKGRLLFIGTTDIDLQRPVLWNMGAIAASGHPGALDLTHRILLASASIPGAFPPVLIEVESGGRRYNEMHIDGGAIAQAFLYPQALELEREAIRRGIVRQRNAYLVRNGRFDPDWATTERSFLSIAQRTIDTMIHYSGVNDAIRIYAAARRDNVAFHLACIGTDFQFKPHEKFDQTYMRALFDYAFEKARNGYPWITSIEAVFGGRAAQAAASLDRNALEPVV